MLFAQVMCREKISHFKGRWLDHHQKNRFVNSTIICEKSRWSPMHFCQDMQKFKRGGGLKVHFELVMVGLNTVKWVWLFTWLSHQAVATVLNSQRRTASKMKCLPWTELLCFKSDFPRSLIYCILKSIFSAISSIFPNTLFAVRPLFFLPTQDFQPWCFSDDGAHSCRGIRDYCMYFLFSSGLAFSLVQIRSNEPTD